MIVAGDDSDSFDFVLLDRAAKRVLGKTATTLISETTKVFVSYLSNVPTYIKPNFLYTFSINYSLATYILLCL